MSQAQNFKNQALKEEVEKYRGLTIMRGMGRYGEFYYVKETAPSSAKELGFQPFTPIGRTLEDVKRIIDETYEIIKDQLIYWTEIGVNYLENLSEKSREVFKYLLEKAGKEDADFIVFDGYGYYKPVRLFENVYYHYSKNFVPNPKEVGIYGHRLLRELKDLLSRFIKMDSMDKLVLLITRQGKAYALVYTSLMVSTREDAHSFRLIYVPGEITG